MRIIAGEARSRVIDAPKGRDTRPTLDRVRENLFNIISRHVPEARVLDLYAGSGALSLEALSRGAREAVLVDRDREAHRVEKANAERLGYTDRARILLTDDRSACALLAREGRRFDLIFLDPPYAMRDLRAVTEALLPLMADGALVIAEHQAGVPYTVCGALVPADERRWGYAGVTFYRQKEAEAP
ncbi:MAG: 16S rRNA (guanine(966)-N(2))-methyltransferase RsmD [Clostridia bacterium]|nr:16S rRNA (guanine(966)-N(2))-methyltransferase RsmD [Clostridia bacterium]